MEGDPARPKIEGWSPKVDPITRFKSRRKSSIKDLTSFLPWATEQHAAPVFVVPCLIVDSDSSTTSMGMGGEGRRGETKGLPGGVEG